MKFEQGRLFAATPRANQTVRSGAASARLVKKAVRRNLALTCLAYVVDDWRKGLRLRAGRLETRSGTPHNAFSFNESLDYIETVYRDYVTQAGGEPIQGRVAEIGPGDNFGVALMLLAAGAREVHAIDRYRPLRDPERQRAIYRGLSERHGMAHLFEGTPDEESIRGLVRHVGEPAETFFAQWPLEFDAILSRAVMEHLYDPLKALDDMAAALRPGGVLVHFVDLRDHGMFAGRHPLTFLTVPDAIYRAMTRNSGRPNRVLLTDYRRWLEESGLTGNILVTRLVGIEDKVEPPAPWDAIDREARARAERAVCAIRPRLARRFRHLPDRDLAIAGILLVASK